MTMTRTQERRTENRGVYQPTTEGPVKTVPVTFYGPPPPSPPPDKDRDSDD